MKAYVTSDSCQIIGIIILLVDYQLLTSYYIFNQRQSWRNTMSAPARELFANNAASTLDGSIDGSQTSFDVIDGSVFPATGNFRLIVESELMLCTSRSSDTLTVVRGAEGSSGASHASGETIAQIVTVGGLAGTLRDNDSLAGSRPALRIVDASGDALVAADFTNLNLGSGSVTDSNGSIVLRKAGQASGDDTSGFYIAAPSAPWTQVAAVRLCMVSNAASGNEHFLGGMIARAAGGRLTIFGVGKVVGTAAPQILIANLDSPTNLNNIALAETSFILGDLIWLKITDDNTNLVFSISDDSTEWIELLSVGRASWLTGNATGIGVAARHANAHTRPSLTRLCSWYTE